MAPVESTAEAVQVALVAVLGPALVHTMVPATVEAGAPAAGIVRTGLMSLDVTVKLALAAVPVVATGPAAVGALVVLVTVPAVLEVTVATT